MKLKSNQTKRKLFSWLCWKFYIRKSILYHDSRCWLEMICYGGSTFLWDVPPSKARKTFDESSTFVNISHVSKERKLLLLALHTLIWNFVVLPQIWAVKQFFKNKRDEARGRNYSRWYNLVPELKKTLEHNKDLFRITFSSSTFCSNKRMLKRKSFSIIFARGSFGCATKRYSPWKVRRELSLSMEMFPVHWEELFLC